MRELGRRRMMRLGCATTVNSAHSRPLTFGILLGAIAPLLFNRSTLNAAVASEIEMAAAGSASRRRFLYQCCGRYLESDVEPYGIREGWYPAKQLRNQLNSAHARGW